MLLQQCTASHRDLNTDPRLGPPCPELQIISAAWRQGGPSEFCIFVSGFHKSHSYLILKPKQPSFSDKPACYLESHSSKVRLGIPVWAESKAWVWPSGPAQPGSSLLGSLSLFALPASQKDANWVVSAGSRQSPGKGDEGGGTAFCQAPRPGSAFPGPGGDSRKLPLSVLPSLGSCCGKARFVLRYK